MKRTLLLFGLCLALGLEFGSPLYANGLLIPVEPDLPPLAMLNHHVTIELEDQVAVTKVEQTFRNHTDRRLEATYVFPVPAGASVREFAMWVNGKKFKGELLQAEKAKQMYTSIVKQTKNPALLDYIGTDLLSLKIFPVPPKGDQKVEVSFTTIAKKEHELIEYTYPLKSDRTSASTLEEFRLTASIKSQQPMSSIYSPTHEIILKQEDNHHAQVLFERHGARLDRDFRLFYTTSGQDVGLTRLIHRPISDEDGYVMMLISPRAELSKEQKVPRDVVFVVDTSGSMMHDKKMDQAKRALRKCIDGLSKDDRFGLVGFATTVDRYRERLTPANKEHRKLAKGWVADLYAGGGTAIHRGLKSALEMRTKDEGRMFTIMLITDGQPTIGETNTEKILADVIKQNTSNTRIFSLGLGHDLNAVFLDQIAEKTRAVNRFVQVDENLDAQVTSFFNKINHPVLSNLKLTTTSEVRLKEVYPPELPDLFHGDQLVVLARYEGAGKSEVVLNGKVGQHALQFKYDLEFDNRSDARPFVEELWARRKVGYLLDQIRINGEKKELVDEVVQLAQHYGITTPYTSYLIMPDATVDLAAAGGRVGGGIAGWKGSYGLNGVNGAPSALVRRSARGAVEQEKLETFARRIQSRADGLARSRDAYQNKALGDLSRPSASAAQGESRAAKAAAPANELAEDKRKLWENAKRLKSTLDRAHSNYRQGQLSRNQAGRLGVDLAVNTNALKNQSQVKATAVRRVNQRRCMELGGVWIDEGFTEKTPTLTIKSQSDAYFRILDKQPHMKSVFQLGNHVVWIAPNGTALVVDTSDGKDRLTDGEIDKLFARKAG